MEEFLDKDVSGIFIIKTESFKNPRSKSLNIKIGAFTSFFELNKTPTNISAYTFTLASNNLARLLKFFYSNSYLFKNSLILKNPKIALLVLKQVNKSSLLKK